mmetsp:Transcript_38161/g.110188  ORF Transcript_38161/g.110188 Transcript_38161/m.110188 type:complete len:204 (-) Transcript_38161:1545-2156(-)
MLSRAPRSSGSRRPRRAPASTAWSSSRCSSTACTARRTAAAPARGASCACPRWGPCTRCARSCWCATPGTTAGSALPTAARSMACSSLPTARRGAASLQRCRPRTMRWRAPTTRRMCLSRRWLRNQAMPILEQWSFGATPMRGTTRPWLTSLIGWTSTCLRAAVCSCSITAVLVGRKGTQQLQRWPLTATLSLSSSSDAASQT